MTAALAVAVAVLSPANFQALTPAGVSAKSVATEYSSAGSITPPTWWELVYPAGVSWMDELKADPELYALAGRETAGSYDPKRCNWSDAKITGFPSCGIFQYQPSTFRMFVKKYKVMASSTDEEIDAAIYDPYIQIYITRLALIDGGWRNWYNSFVYLGLAKDYLPAWTPTAQGLVLKSLD